MQTQKNLLKVKVYRNIWPWPYFTVIDEVYSKVVLYVEDFLRDLSRVLEEHGFDTSMYMGSDNYWKLDLKLPTDEEYDRFEELSNKIFDEARKYWRETLKRIEEYLSKIPELRDIVINDYSGNEYGVGVEFTVDNSPCRCEVSVMIEEFDYEEGVLFEVKPETLCIEPLDLSMDTLRKIKTMQWIGDEEGVYIAVYDVERDEFYEYAA